MDKIIYVYIITYTSPIETADTHIYVYNFIEINKYIIFYDIKIDNRPTNGGTK